MRKILAYVIMVLVCASAWGQPFPNKPIKLIIPFGPGSGTDIVGRALAKNITEQSGVPIVIDNRAGGEGFIGSQAVVQAPADGYTLLLASSSSQIVNPLLFKKIPYDPIKDFKPIAPVARSSMILVVNSTVKAKTFSELVSLAKSDPNSLNIGFGSASTRLVAELMLQRTGLNVLRVPYKTPALVITDMLGGQVAMSFIDYPTAAGHLKSGKLKAIAVSGAARMRELPEVPTLQETGLSDFDVTAWYGVWAPASTPAATVETIRAIISKALANEEMRRFIDHASMDKFPAMSVDEFARFQKQESVKIGRIVKASGIEPQ